MAKESFTPPEPEFEPEFARSARIYMAYLISLSVVGYFWPEILYVASRGAFDLRHSTTRQVACGAFVITGLVLPSVVSQTLSHLSRGE